MRIAAAALVVLATTGLAPGAEDCGAISDQAGMNACAAKAYKASDAELNALYKQIEGRLSDDPDRKKLFTASQRSWIAFRDAECAFASAGVAGGSAMPFVLDSCTKALTDKRVGDFKLYLSCEEGDLSCPVPAGN